MDFLKTFSVGDFIQIAILLGSVLFYGLRYGFRIENLEKKSEADSAMMSRMSEEISEIKKAIVVMQTERSLATTLEKQLHRHTQSVVKELRSISAHFDPNGHRPTSK